MRTITIDPRKLKLLDVNARFMRHEQYQNLVSNVKKDGALESTPLLAYASEASATMTDDEPGKFIVVSGNHRTRAAIDAELADIVALAYDRVLPHNEFVAKQLAHNAITGEDDPATLKALYDSISDVDLRQYAGLDDATLGLLAKVEAGSLSEANLSFQTVNIVFLPDELESARTAWQQARALASGDEVWLARWRDYDLFLDSLELSGATHNIKNVATQLAVVLAIFGRNVGELRDGWLTEEGEVRHTGRVPFHAIFGVSGIPSRDAAVVHRAIERARQQDTTLESAADVLVKWAQEAMNAEARATTS